MKKEWKMPAWMEPYRSLIQNTGGNPVEELVNGNARPDTNLPLSTLQACVKSQVSLLFGLKEAGLLVSVSTQTKGEKSAVNAEKQFGRRYQDQSAARLHQTAVLLGLRTRLLTILEKGPLTPLEFREKEYRRALEHTLSIVSKLVERKEVKDE